VVAALVVGLAIAIWQANRAEEQSRRAETEARTSRAVETFLKDIFLANSRAQPDPVKARLTTARELLALGVRKVNSALEDAPDAKLRTLKTLADLQHQLSLDDEAVALDRQQVALAKRLYGTNHPRVAEALVDLSSALMTTQANNEREGVLNEALAILDRNKDVGSQLRGNLLGDFAQWAYAYDLEKALRYAEESVRILRRYAPSKDLTEALIMEGVTRSQIGQYARADALLSESLSAATATEGALSPKVPRIHAYRAETRYYEGEWDRAGQDLHEGLRLARILGGDEDMQTIQLEQRLGLFLLRTSRAKEALPHVERARAAVLKVSPADDAWFVPMTLETTGLVLGEVGDLEAGLRDLGEAARGWRKHHAGSSDIISGCEREANLLIVAGRLGEADALLAEVAAVRARLQDYSTNQNGNVIARTNWLIAAGRAQEAIPLLKDFIVKDAAPKSVSVTRLQRSVQQARVELALGHPVAVIDALRELRQIVGNTPLRPYLKSYEADADQLEGKAQMLSGRPDTALPLLQQAHALYGEIYDDRVSLTLADAKVALADCLMTLGRIDDARELATRAAAIQAAHREVGEQYRKPLRAVRTRLART
jgi:serine/threonine-protein kinase